MRSIHDEDDWSRYKTHTVVYLIVNMPKCTFMLLPRRMPLFQIKMLFLEWLCTFETTRHDTLSHTPSQCWTLIMCWCIVIFEPINTAIRLIFNDVGMCFLPSLPCCRHLLAQSLVLVYLKKKQERLKRQNPVHGAMHLQEDIVVTGYSWKLMDTKSICFDYLLYRSTRKIEINETVTLHFFVVASTFLSSPKNTQRKRLKKRDFKVVCVCFFFSFRHISTAIIYK